MSFWLYSGIIAAAAIIGCLIMKKIEPDNKWYKWYVFAIWLLLTVLELLRIKGFWSL